MITNTDWRNPLFAAVTVVSLLVALLLFVIMVGRRFHLRLLHAMLPKKVRVCLHVCVCARVCMCVTKRHMAVGK